MTEKWGIIIYKLPFEDSCYISIENSTFLIYSYIR